MIFTIAYDIISIQEKKYSSKESSIVPYEIGEQTKKEKNKYSL